MKKIIILIIMILCLSSFVTAVTDFSLDNSINATYYMDLDLTDEKGNHDITDHGVGFRAGVIGNASTYAGDGSNDYGEFQNSNGLYGANGTISLWFYNPSPGCTDISECWILGKWDDPNYESFFKVQGADEKISFNLDNGCAVVSSSATPLDSWVMLTVKWNTTYCYIYFNETLVGTDAFTRTGSKATGVTLGYNADTGLGNRQAMGYMDELTIWSRMLNNNEILQIKDCGINGTHILNCGVPPTPNNFTITTTNFFYGETLYTFNATINGITYQSNTSGYIVTNLLDNSSSLYNINVSAPLHFPRMYSNYNLSTNPLLAVLNATYYRYNITAIDLTNLSRNINNFTINVSYGSFSQSVTTTTGTIFINATNINKNHSITIDAAGYEIKTISLNITDWMTNYEFSLYTQESFNISIYNEKTNKLIDNQNITIEFIGDNNVYNYSTATGKLYVDLLVPDNYAIRYYGEGYGRKRTYYLTLSDRSYNLLDFYLLNNSFASDVIVTVYDQATLQTLSGAYVYLQRYFLDEAQYKTVAMFESDPAGNSYFDIEQQIEKYKILVDYPFGVRKLTTESFYIESTSINVYLELISNIGTGYYNQEGISVSMSSSNTTFIVSWADTQNVATKYCLELRRLGSYGVNTINSSCSSANSGSLEVSGFINDTTNYGVFISTINGENKVLGSIWHETISDTMDMGTYGIFLALMIVFVMVFIVQIHVIAGFVAVLGLIFAKSLHLISIDWPYLFGMAFLSIILGIIIKMKK